MYKNASTLFLLFLIKGISFLFLPLSLKFFKPSDYIGLQEIQVYSVYINLVFLGLTDMNTYNIANRKSDFSKETNGFFVCLLSVFLVILLSLFFFNQLSGVVYSIGLIMMLTSFYIEYLINKLSVSPDKSDIYKLFLLIRVVLTLITYCVCFLYFGSKIELVIFLILIALSNLFLLSYVIYLEGFSWPIIPSLEIKKSFSFLLASLAFWSRSGLFSFLILIFLSKNYLLIYGINMTFFGALLVIIEAYNRFQNQDQYKWFDNYPSLSKDFFLLFFRRYILIQVIAFFIIVVFVYYLAIGYLHFYKTNSVYIDALKYFFYFATGGFFYFLYLLFVNILYRYVQLNVVLRLLAFSTALTLLSYLLLLYCLDFEGLLLAFILGYFWLFIFVFAKVVNIYIKLKN